jgi:hypothetical protein
MHGKHPPQVHVHVGMPLFISHVFTVNTKYFVHHDTSRGGGTTSKLGCEVTRFGHFYFTHIIVDRVTSKNTLRSLTFLLERVCSQLRTALTTW